MAQLQTGLDVLLASAALKKKLAGAGRVALLAHPASVTARLEHAGDVIAALRGVQLAAVFGPQHGARGDKQDNMIESPDFTDPRLGIPVYSLYGKTRRPTPEMLASFDTLVVDLQDLGCRIYTFITTLRYVLEDCTRAGKAVWVLDRPNPAGRPVEGLSLVSGQESFVGAAPIPMRHGLTMGELAGYFGARFAPEVDLTVVRMKGWAPERAPGYGWPAGQREWVNPSPNAASLGMARAYAGTVMLEGTTLSEGRGTTRALEVMGAPDLDFTEVLARMRKIAPKWMQGAALRACYFEPTFHKHAGKLCSGFQIHAEAPALYTHAKFRPWRLVALALRAIRELHPDYPLWRDFEYEYAFGRKPIDVINGGPALREWVDGTSRSPRSKPADLDARARADEKAWEKERREFLLY